MRGTLHYLKNGKHHREDGPAVIYPNNILCDYFFEGKKYKKEKDFPNQTWEEKVESLKRAEELKIFL